MPALPHRRPHPALVVLVTALALLLTACGGTTTPAATPQPTASANPFQRYVALGDSYSAAPMVPTTDVAGGCFRSSSNYPALVARALGSTLVDRTCGGAGTGDVDKAQNNGIPPQRTALQADTQLVTVGLGGNDESVFTRLVFTCTTARAQDPNGAPCRANQQRGGTDLLLAALKRTTGRVAAVLHEVKKLSPHATVLLVGYPHIVDARHRCAKLPLARGDYAYAESVNKALDTSLRRAAQQTGTTYVDTYTATTGHDICASDPWINGDRTDRTKALEYHPFAAEQQAVAKLVVKALQG